MWRLPLGNHFRKVSDLRLYLLIYIISVVSDAMFMCELDYRRQNLFSFIFTMKFFHKWTDIQNHLQGTTFIIFSTNYLFKYKTALPIIHNLSKKC